MPKRSSNSKSKSSSSKPSSWKESKSSSHPGLGFTHCMYHLDSNDAIWSVTLIIFRRILTNFLSTGMTAMKVRMYQLGSFMTVTQTNSNTPMLPFNKFAHADKICLEKKHSQTDLFYKFGFYVKDISGSISLFGLGKKSGGIHSDEVVSLKIPLSSEMAGLQSNNALCTCPWCQKLPVNRLTLSNHIRLEHYHLTLICHVCGMYHTPCRDVMKSHMKSCNERNHNLVSEKIFYSFRVDQLLDAPEPVRTNTSHSAETSYDDTPIKSSKQ